jgi:hypothetical protein
VSLGFTGSQFGGTPAQADRVLRGARKWVDHVVHHGDCIGWDATMHGIARELGMRVELHPPSDDSKRAWCAMLPGEVVHPPKSYLQRNGDIARGRDILVACPRNELGEELRSGTWSTVRRARDAGVPVVVVRPSGRVEWLPARSH